MFSVLLLKCETVRTRLVCYNIIIILTSYYILSAFILYFQFILYSQTCQNVSVFCIAAQQNHRRSWF